MQSLWLDSVKNHRVRYDGKIGRSFRTEALVIGGGMAGVLCAYRLKEMGVDCIVVEGGRLGEGTTGHTTAKITSQHGNIYAGLIRKIGLERALQYYQMNEKALDTYRELAKRHPCHFEEKHAYIYSVDDRAELEKEAEAYHRMHIPMHFDERPPLPFAVAGALGMERQAQFNPLELLVDIAKGLEIYENTFVHEIREQRAITSHGMIKADHIVLATHYPLVNIPGLYFMKLYQHRSYVIALENAPQIGGMYLDEKEGGYSFRNYGDMLLLGGGSHRTGCKGGGFDVLRELAGRAYADATEKYAWATQDCMTLDGMPYVGVQRRAEPNLYVATGFNKWGMTGAMSAAMIIADLIVNRRSEYEALLSPQRSVFHPQLIQNVFTSLYGYVRPGKRCTHMGCALKWNGREKTWDCPCHGSRFDASGNVINNPAKKRIADE